MSTSIIFENRGVLDLYAVQTFGVNVKPNSENPIGFFGTGLKYALAICARLSADVRLYTGGQAYKLSTETRTFRGKEFSQVLLLSGEDFSTTIPLGFTTELGKNWEPWMAFREFYCNALDEGGSVWLGKLDRRVLDSERTYISIRHPKFEEVYENRDLYFLTTKPAAVIEGLMAFHYGQGGGYYYRGISVGQLPKPSLFRYNALCPTDLSEDRTLKSSWTFSYQLVRSIALLRDANIIETILAAPVNTYEDSLDFSSVDDRPSDEFMAVGRKLLAGNQLFNKTLRSLIAKHEPPPPPVPASLSPLNKVMLERAITFCKRIGFPVDYYPIVVTETLGQQVMGQAKNGTIYLSRIPFTMGTKQVAATLLEEFFHLHESLLDCTRAFQDFLLLQVISFGEQINGEPI
jgi:hypothetical protein